ncbi:hypothetical protein ACHAQH_006393 [Verticillium albo-atrum]
MCSKQSTWKVLEPIVMRKMVEFTSILAICFFSELLIWCLSLALRLIHFQFLSAILGMLVVFLVMTTLSKGFPSTERFYLKRIKSKVDFINKNLGVGFPVPIITISREDSLGAKGIGKVFGNFLLTNVIFWTLVFFLAWAIVAGVVRLPRRSSPSPAPEHHSTSTEGEKTPRSSDQAQAWTSDQPPRLELPPEVGRRVSDTTTLRNSLLEYLTDNEAALSHDVQTSSDCPPESSCPTPVPNPQTRQPSLHSMSSFEDDEQQSDQQWLVALRKSYSILLPAVVLVVIGIPISLGIGDDRVLDGCTLWFTWASAGKFQAILSSNNRLPQTLRIPKAVMLVFTTLMNPVLITILFMMAYTRAKAAATGTPLHDLLAAFASGTSISDLWSHAIGQYTLKKHQPDYFGAGDAALAILECGIVVWGFKLYECRAQLASRAGIAVIVVSTASAAINVFGSTLLAKLFGLAAPEALAFAARCTTLALARPAMESLGGNRVINAALVVSNGIFGQLCYPFVLKHLGVAAEKADKKELETVESNKDSARIIAVGTAIGINGAAMGVSYLYQQKSRAAPYSVLSMTVFGVMTVVFTGIKPSAEALKALVA